MSPVPYPKNFGAYPTAKPAPIAASAVTQPSAVTQSSASNVIEEIAAPSADVKVQPIDEPTAVSQVEEATQEPQQAKFFPLKPTASSIFVATETSEEKTPEDFDISSSLTHEPRTNSIVLDQVPDALLSGEIITDTGEVLITGSIELPAITGEMSVVSESPEADLADDTDSSSLNLTNVAPVRAPAVLNSKASIGAIPSKHRRTSGQLMAMLTLALLIVTVGSLYIMAAVLGVV